MILFPEISNMENFDESESQMGVILGERNVSGYSNDFQCLPRWEEKFKLKSSKAWAFKSEFCFLLLLFCFKKFYFQGDTE